MSKEMAREAGETNREIQRKQKKEGSCVYSSEG
jgi:hypothetical protein